MIGTTIAGGENMEETKFSTILKRFGTENPILVRLVSEITGKMASFIKEYNSQEFNIDGEPWEFELDDDGLFSFRYVGENRDREAHREIKLTEDGFVYLNSGNLVSTFTLGFILVHFKRHEWHPAQLPA